MIALPHYYMERLIETILLYLADSSEYQDIASHHNLHDHIVAFITSYNIGRWTLTAGI